MSRRTKIILIVVLALLILVALPKLTEQRSTAPTVVGMTATEYTDHAVEGCVETNGTETYCRCFYEEMLSRYSVADVWEMDMKVERDGDSYVFSDEQIAVAKRCLE